MDTELKATLIALGIITIVALIIFRKLLFGSRKPKLTNEEQQLMDEAKDIQDKLNK